MGIIENFYINTSELGILGYLVVIILFAFPMWFILYYLYYIYLEKKGQSRQEINKNIGSSFLNLFFLSIAIVGIIIFISVLIPPNSEAKEIYTIKNILANNYHSYDRGEIIHGSNFQKGKLLIWDLSKNEEYREISNYLSTDLLLHTKSDYLNPHTLYLVEIEKTYIGKYSVSSAPAYTYLITTYVFYMPDMKYIGKMSYNYQDPNEALVGTEWITQGHMEKLLLWIKSANNL